jgi:iron complex transport system substrate-binding protein
VARGEQLIAAFDERLAAVSTPDRRQVSALAYQANSLVSGPGSLLDAAFAAAGIANVAGAARLGRGGHLPLEALVAAPPDLVVLAQAPETYRTAVADNLRHPALGRLLAARPHVVLPMPLWLCGTPRIADAVALLAQARKSAAKEPMK